VRPKMLPSDCSAVLSFGKKLLLESAL